MMLVLVGYAGSGKSSLAKRLAKALGVGYVDTDTLVEQSVGATIADIFHYEGEEYFRSVERNVLDSTAEEDNIIVSTGGGLPIFGDNMQKISELGLSIYLRRTPKNIMSRLSPYGRQKRPKFRGLNDEELLAFMTTHMAEREPIYSKADVVIDCDQMSDDEIINLIMRNLKNLKR